MTYYYSDDRTKKLRDDLLQLGVDAPLDCVTRVQVADVRPRDVAHGRDASSRSLAAVATSAYFDRVVLPELEEHGIRVERSIAEPSVVAIGTGSTPPEICSPRIEGSRSDILVQEGHVFIDLARFQDKCLLRLADRASFLLLRRTELEAGIECDVLVPPIELPARPEIRSDVLAWSAGDDWLEREVRARLERDDPFDHVVAVGLVARLARRPPDEERARVRAILKARDHSSLEPERAWARGLPAATALWIERRGLVASDRFEESLERLADSPLLDDPAWRSSLLDVLCERDELEGVLLLLLERRDQVRLARRLERLDREGSLTIRALPPFEGASSVEQLRRAAEIDPEAWWLRPVIEES